MKRSSRNAPPPLSLVASCLCLWLCHFSSGADAVLSSGAMTGDADSGVSTLNTYTAIANIIGGDVMVNGVTFLGSGAGLSGTGWALTGVPNLFGSGGNHTTTFGASVIDDLFDGFQYNGNPGVLTLSGLTAGQTYVVTLYNQAWGLGANRTQIITTAEGASLIYNEDALEASVVRYTFVATGATTTLNFAPQITGTTMHFYGLSNEQVFNNTWSPNSGTSWNTAANWSTGVVPDSVGSSASFSAQGGPTTVTLDAAATTGHVEFLGSGAYTVSGANTLTLQADAGGVSVLKSDTGTHTISTPVQLNSAVSKFGNGTVKLAGAISGTGKGITVSSGGLVLESATADLTGIGNIVNSGSFSIANAAAQSYSGVISGTGGFEKSGAGTLTLGSPHSYSGATVISGGTLKLGAVTSLAIANPSFETYTSLAGGNYGYQPAGASWTFDTNSGISLNGGPFFAPTNHDGNAGGFVQNTGGGISQTINVTTPGLYTFSFQGAGRSGVNGPNGLLFQVDGSTVRTVDPGEISQATWQTYSVTVNLTAGSHTIAFLGNNTLGGDKSTAIDAVTGLTGGQLPSATALSLTNSGATLDLSGNAQTVGSLAGVAGTSVLNDGAFTVSGSASTNFAGVISGAGSFAKGGSGTLTLSGANTYAGSTTVNGGTLQLSGGSLPATTALNLAASGATLDVNGGAQTVASLTGVAGSAVTLGSGSLTTGDATSTTFPGNISGSGSLTKSGTGTLTLAGTNSYGGGTTISGGTLKSQTANTSGTGVMSVASGATWNLAATSHTVAGLTGAGNITRSGVISTGADGAALISGSKTYALKLDFGNNGGATVNGVAFDSVATSGTGWSLSGAGSLYGGADTGGYDQLVGDFYYGGNPGSLTFSGLMPGETYEAVIYTKVGHWGNRTQNATFDEDGAGPVSNQLLNTDPGTVGYYSYRFVAASSSMSITMAPTNPGNTFHWFAASLESVATAPQTLTIGDAGNYSFTGVISGPTALVKQGTGTQELTGASTYTAGTTISGGAIMAHHASAVGTGTVSMASGANYLAWWNTGASTVTNNFTLNGPGGSFPGGSKTTIYADGGPGGFAEYTLTGTVTLNATSSLGGHNTNNLRVSGQITGPGGLTKGAGRTDENNTLILGSTANDFSGDTTVTKGTVKLAASEVIPHGAGKGIVIVNGGTTLDLGGFSETINNLSGSGTITSTASVGTPVYFTNDAGTGISASKTYTHALDFAEGTPVTINGVTFTGAGLSGGNWTLTGAGPSAGNGATGATGDISRLLTNFYYNGNPATLTLSGLTPGVTYETRLYERQWGGDRTQLFTVTAGSGTGTSIFNEDASTTPSFIPFRFTADGTGQATITTNMIGTGTYHWFGATNEVVASPVLTVGDAADSAFSGTITGPLGLTKVGAGTLTVSGANTYAGPTTLSGGTLLLGAANTLPDSSAITLTGGKLATGNFSDSAGPLSLLSDSVIDMGTGSGSVLTFANLDPADNWSGVLKVWNWTGTIWTVGADRLVFTTGTSNLTPEQLATVQFYTDGGFTPLGSGATFIGGDLVPVPEPSAALAVLALLTAAAWKNRRSFLHFRP